MGRTKEVGYIISQMVNDYIRSYIIGVFSPVISRIINSSFLYLMFEITEVY